MALNETKSYTKTADTSSATNQDIDFNAVFVRTVVPT